MVVNKIVTFSILSLFLGIIIGLSGGYYLAETSNANNSSHKDNKFALEKRSISNPNLNNADVNAKIIKKAKEEVLSEINDIEKQIPSLDGDTIANESSETNDELKQDSNNIIVFQNDDEIVIRQEKLLHIATSFIFKISDSTKQKYPSIDSNNQALLEKNAEIKQVQTKEHSIEYWETPLNYKGYKYANYKLILYGLEPNDLAILIQQNKQLYFRYKNDYYVIKQTNSFTPLKKVSVDFNDSYLEKL